MVNWSGSLMSFTLLSMNDAPSWSVSPSVGTAFSSTSSPCAVASWLVTVWTWLICEKAW